MIKTFYISTLLILTIFTNLKGQVSIGPKLGLGISNYKSVKIPANYIPILTPQIGAVVNIKIGNIFNIRPELLFLQRGATMKGEGINVDTETEYTFTNQKRVSYLELPINIAAGMKAGTGRLELYTGPSFGLALGGKYKSESPYYSNSGKIVAKKYPNNYKGTNSYINPLNISLNFGIDYKFNKGFLFQIEYNLGLSNIGAHYENSTAESKRNEINITKASSLNFAISYLFGL